MKSSGFKGFSKIPVIPSDSVTLSMASPGRAGGIISVGFILIAIGAALFYFLPPAYSAIAIGALISAVMCFVILVAMPRSIQISLMGVTLGITADAGYAKFSDETPVTVANGLIRMAHAILEAVGLIAEDAKVQVTQVLGYGVWSFILATMIFMLLSFAVKHDG